MVQSNASASTATVTSDLQMVMQMLQKMQVEANNGFQELKKEFREEFTSRVDQVNMRMEHLASRVEQGESHRAQDMKNIQEQIDALKLANSTTPLTTDESSATNKGRMKLQAIESGCMAHIQSQNLLRMALDKQIDELKPYYGKKQENVDVWIKKIDKLAEIGRMPDEEIFMLARLKLQGDAEKWWDNKKKEIDSWITLKSKLVDTFGALGKTNKLELEALLHRRQQNLNEPATKYWNDMMSHCSAYDENMSTQDRVWRVFNGALPEFRYKYENKAFDDVDQLLKALIQHEENRLRTSYDEQEHHDQTSNLARGSHNAVWNHHQFPKLSTKWQITNNDRQGTIG
jgi:Zn-finger domain-containing protein